MVRSMETKFEDKESGCFGGDEIIVYLIEKEGKTEYF